MSAESQGGAGRREVAYRLFAAEFDDADFEYSADDDERSPNYVITPTGARVNRLFVVGVLTEVEPVNEDMLRARIVDPTGAFVVYAGQYQPDAQTFLERADPPQFVAVTGKARTFEPEDGNVIYTSIRPETINEVDAETRDRWVVQTARHTLDRIATFLDALDREERGDDLAAALESEGIDAGLAEGVALGIDHYGTTTAYLDALRETAIAAAEVVAGDREEVEPLELAPEEGGETDVDVETGVVASTSDGSRESAIQSRPETATEPATEPATGEETTAEAASEEATGAESTSAEADATETEAATAGGADAVRTESDESSASDDLGDFASYGDETEADEDSDEGVAPDEMYEFDEEERREIEEEYGTEFNTGNEVEETVEGGSEPDETTESAGSEEPPGPASDEEVGGGEEEQTSDEESPEGAAESEAPPTEVDLEGAVMDAMEELDAGDGADRGELIEAVAGEYGVEEADVEEAIQDALMSGKCYEPGDDRLKAI